MVVQEARKQLDMVFPFILTVVGCYFFYIATFILKALIIFLQMNLKGLNVEPKIYKHTTNLSKDAFIQVEKTITLFIVLF